MTTQIIMMAVLMALGLGYTYYVTNKRKAGMPAAFRMFFERTGYRYADIYNQPLEAHIMHGEKLVAQGYGGSRVHMIRDFHGMPVHCVQETWTEKKDNRTHYVRSASWWTPLAAAPRIRIQIAERSLTSVGKVIKEAFSNQSRTFRQELPLTVQSGDPELDKRLVFFGVDANEVLHVLRTPGLRELLLGCAEVDLLVHNDKIVFSDPTQKNMNAGMGGTVGTMAVATDMMKTMELTIPVHDRMAQILGTVARACQ